MWRRRWIGAAALTAAVAVPGAGGALAASLSEADLTVQPSRLPKQGGAPVTIIVTGTVSQDDRVEVAKAVTLRLDRQLTVHGAGQPTCQRGEVTGKPPAQARRVCGAALVGSGRLTQRVQYPEQAPFDLPASVLLFNGAGNHLITYTFIGDPNLGPAAIATVGTAAGSTVEISLPKDAGGLTTSFHFRLGRTWTKDGRTLGYLSGRCATGTLHNKIMLTLAGSTETRSLTQRCQGTG